MTESLESVPAGAAHAVAPMPALNAGIPLSLDNISVDNLDDKKLAQRYGKNSRWSRAHAQELTFEFTRDPALLHQYYGIYEEQFRIVHHADRYHHDIEDEHDRRGHIIVARQGNLCVGGARLSVKTPRQPQPLPIEMNGFRLEDHFPHLGQKELSYGQIGRICLLPEFRGGDITRKLFWHLYRKVVALGLDEVFGTATIPNARIYRQNCIAMGLKNVRIYTDIELPEYPMCEDIKFYLIGGLVEKLSAEVEVPTELQAVPKENIV